MSNINLGTDMESIYLGRKLDSYTGVIIRTGMNNNGKEVVYSAGNNSGYVLEVSNPIGTQEMAYAILAGLKLRSSRYQPFDANKSLIDPAAEIGDGVTVNATPAVIMSVNTDHTHLMAADVSAPMSDDVDHEFHFEPKTVREFKRESSYTRSRLSITQDEIRAEVRRAQNAETTLSASLSIQADRITAEVARATGSETTLSSRITQTADAIVTEVTRATGAEGQLSTQIAQRLDSITLSVSSSAGSSTFTIKDGSTTLDTKTLDLSVKAVNISGKLTVGQLADGSVVTSSQSETEYYLSTSSSSATGGSWSTTVPTWASGKYIWTRTKTTDTLNDNTTSVTYKPSQNGAYDKNLTNALSTASSASSAAGAAQTAANSAITRERTIYYAQTPSGGTPDAPTAWVGDTTGGTGIWTCKRPQYSTSYPDCYTATERLKVDGTFVCSAVVLDQTTTVIDGDHILTNSITANKISVTDLQTLNATIGGWAIGTATIRKTTDTADCYLQSANNADNTYNAICVRTRPNSSGSWTNQFYVRYNGYLYARNANIEGTVTATSGTIGGITLQNGVLTVDNAHLGSGAVGTSNMQTGCVTGGSGGIIAGGTITTTNTNSGINSGVNGGINYNDATTYGTSSYPAIFTCGSLYARDTATISTLTVTEGSIGTFTTGGHQTSWKSLTVKNNSGTVVTIHYLGY